jgi:quinohemoprotein amine dehydrogenase
MRRQLLQLWTILLVTVAAALCQEVIPVKEPSKDPTKETDAGIPVTDPLTITRCGGCHQADSNGNLTRISWIRTTPEGWQEAIKRMVQLNGLQLSPDDARKIVRYLANEHGLAPEETEPIRWFLEMTQPQSEPIPSPAIRRACTTCHSFAKPESWRRTPAEWQLLKNMHVGYFPLSQFVAFRSFRHAPDQDPNAPKPKEPVDEAIDYLSKNYSLYSSAWSNWRAQVADTDASGRWLITASAPGKGKYFGEMTVTRSGPGEFTTQTTLTSARDGSKLELPGRSFIYTGYEWRGSAKSDQLGMLRQVMTVSANQSSLQGRWFWGAYQEFGFTVSAQRESRDVTVLGTDVTSIRAGSKDVPMKLYGQHFPSDLKAADITLGAGVKVSKVASVSPTLVSLTVDVDPKVFAGKRSIAIHGRAASDAFSVYDHIEYIKINSETALAHTGGTVAKKGFVQFEAHAYSSGADGLPNTADDVDLGPVPATWSIEEFISHNNDNDKEFVGYIDGNGLFTPSGDGPNPQRRLSADNIGDVWVIAKYEGKDVVTKAPLEAKSYLVVGIPDFLRFDSPEVGGSVNGSK